MMRFIVNRMNRQAIIARHFISICGIIKQICGAKIDVLIITSKIL